MLILCHYRLKQSENWHEQTPDSQFSCLPHGQLNYIYIYTIISLFKITDIHRWCRPINISTSICTYNNNWQHVNVVLPCVTVTSQHLLWIVHITRKMPKWRWMFVFVEFESRLFTVLSTVTLSLEEVTSVVISSSILPPVFWYTLENVYKMSNSSSLFIDNVTTYKGKLMTE